MKKIIFSLPGLFEFSLINFFLIDYMKKYPEKFNEDCEIGSFYGSFPNCIWNGGRGVDGRFEIDDVINTVKKYNDNNIALRYTFTNCKLSKDDILDHIGNKILETTSKYQTIKNDVNVHSNYLKEHIENRFKNDFNIVYSTTLCIKDLDIINNLSSTNLLVADYYFNNKFNLIDQMKYPENIEFIVNESCRPNCPARHKHYENISDFFLKNETELMKCVFKSDSNKENYYRANTVWDHHITLEQIRNEYLPRGFNKFKLIGRGVSVLKVIEGYVEYLVKPEYQNEVRYDFIKLVLRE